MGGRPMPRTEASDTMKVPSDGRVRDGAIELGDDVAHQDTSAERRWRDAAVTKFFVLAHDGASRDSRDGRPREGRQDDDDHG